MATVKKALLSPAVNAQQQMPSSTDEQQLFEDKFSQMAYQAFSGKFPDLVAEIVTFKILDSDLETGTAIGAFILEQEGDYVYIPCIISENELKPFDMMYIKSKDIFLPLNTQWLEEVKKGTISSLGEGSKLPETVPTDVDIRNIVVPPTTGRYSYASVSPRNRMYAEASEPLGRKLTKLAGIGPFPGGGAPGAPGGQQSDFNPQLWATFVEQFQRTQQQTPGQALDSGSLDVEVLAKMYKSHTKTWEMMSDPGANPLAAQQMPGLAADGSDAQQMGGAAAMQQQQAPQQAGMQQQAVPGQQAGYKTANAMPRTIGSKVEGIVNNAVRSAGLGALSGGATAFAEGNHGDIPDAVLRGAMGGALLGPVGSLAGEEVAAQLGSTAHPERAQRLGRSIGSLMGGYVGANTDPILTQSRYAADHSAVLIDMVKHAASSRKYTPRLTQFLSDAPNRIKQAYAQFLERNPKLLKTAAELYGENELINALTLKAAGTTEQGGKLQIADRNTDAKEYSDFFGEEAPTAFRGVALRGYYFKDTRPSLNLAVQVQEPHNFQDTRSSGVYRLFTSKGSPKGALVIASPIDLVSDGRVTFPDQKAVSKVETKVPKNTHNQEYDSMRAFYPGEENSAGPDVDRSHKVQRLAILENGDYMLTDSLFGEQTSEVYLKGSKLYNAVLKAGKSSPAKGKGAFVIKHGATYHASCPVELSEISTGSDGVIRGKITSPGGWDTKAFVIDPRSPGNRPRKLQAEKLVIIPASWKWMPLGEDKGRDSDYLRSARGLSDIVVNALGSMGASKAVVRRAGQSMYDVDGARTITKKAALQQLATNYQIHASAAEAMLKIAHDTGSCKAYIITPSVYRDLTYQVKTAQGAVAPQTSMGAPPAMQQPPPVPPMPGAAPAAPPAPAPEAPPAGGGSPIDQAFGETIGGLQQQMSELQAQLDVLMTVQDRAQQIAGGGGEAPPAPEGSAPMPPAPAGGTPAPMPAAPPAPGGTEAAPAPMDPGMQGMPEGMDPAAGVDPAAQGQEQAMEQPLPVMRTEEPSSTEIASQINPAFLGDAAQLHETGAFDAGTIASLARNGNLRNVSSQYAASLEESVDDLGRTLLTLYMQEPQLKEQLGDDTFLDLETQLRDTFHGLGKLVLSLTHNSSMLESDNALA